MTIPIVLIAGFLGAGKTTLVNGLLREPGGRRIAAIVNDFGTIDVDAALLNGEGDGVLSLKNGCICCSLQGDLLRTLSSLMRRCPAPEAVVIETSGASDPAEIVRSLLDPVIHGQMPLDTVATVIDARHLADRPSLFEDPLWRSQLDAADLCLVTKIDVVDRDHLATVRAELARRKGRNVTFDVVDGAISSDLLFAGGGHTPASASQRQTSVASERFESLSWTSARSLSLGRFQAVIARLAPRLLRAKGFVTFDTRPDEPMIFQLVGTRATVAPTETPMPPGVAASLVIIAELGSLNSEEVTAFLNSTTCS
ncbi:cobalamin biosynthesis protein CobW [Methylobacterium sp. UNC300MFChir4.1]|uniref:CobW family GTP-binding protein n=1 Tax=Methylobacterium sp. UNC300MFChir4.1 TaxID=1502747 RepID=UPI0008CA998F|nr:GTP-binding protein [Methylobacterium sp. UNC300MFChir4.1]SEN87966.1 cobalamin biosynthesis protein CobW [Methylobacterium sp. UNC300MFChir4.1]